MVEGLIILTQRTDFSTVSRICFALSVILIVPGVIGFGCSLALEHSFRKSLMCFLCVCIGVGLVWLGFRFPSDIIYEAYADETVTFDEITDHYKIIDVDGKLLTLEAIENDG